MKHSYMKMIISGCILLFLSLSTLVALEGEIVFVLGSVDYQPAGGALQFADFGTPLREGDSVITGADGQAEISLPNGSSVRIDADTVFRYQRGVVVPGGEPENVFDVVRGQVSFKFNRLGNSEPNIRARSSLAGVRGTEFSVAVGADGQSVFVLSEGAVEVSADGQSVELAPGEGVEVSLENGLGETFPAIEGEFDFSSYLAESDSRALEQPAATLEALIPLLNEYLDAAESFYQEHIDALARIDELGVEILKLREEGKDEEADTLGTGEFVDMGLIGANSLLNYRFYVLSAQSLRRFVSADLYVSQRALSLGGDATDSDFISVYEEFSRIYEERAIQFFVRADI